MLRTRRRHWTKRVGYILEMLRSWMTTTASGSLIESRWVWLELLYLRNYFTRLSQNIMKLSQGEYVALEKLENAYSACPIVQQLYVHGDSLQDHLIGILVPEPPTLVALAERALGKDDPRVKHIAIDPANPAVLNLSPETRVRLQELAAEPKVATAIQEMLNAYGKKLQLRGFEFVKRVHINFDPFTVENHMLTPTFKLRRCVCVLWGFWNSTPAYGDRDELTEFPMWQTRRVLCVQDDLEQDVRGGQGYEGACAYQTLKAR